MTDIDKLASSLTPNMVKSLTLWCNNGVVHGDVEDATKRGLVNHGLGTWSGGRVVLTAAGEQVRKLLIRKAMFARRAEMIAAHPEAKTAGELAPFMGLHEREYWEWVLDKLAQEMDEAEAAAEGQERSDAKTGD